MQFQDDVPQSFPIVEINGEPRIEAFGHIWPVQNDISLHLNAFRLGLRKEDGALGKTRHLLEAYMLIWPQHRLSINEWTITRFKSFCEDFTEDKKVICMAGGSGTAKSRDAAYYALMWWWALPTERAVLVCSTTLTMLKKRIWSYISEGMITARGNMPGHYKGSPPPTILFDTKDDKHGIHGLALREGAKEKALGDLIGIHPKEGLLAIVDEATDVTAAIEDAQTNWDSGGVNFQEILIGNSKGKLDPHGRASTPKNGWGSVDPDVHTRWETANGTCLFFDCYKSPAITSPVKERFPFLITEKKIKSEEKRLGKNDPRFWRFVRGFWPPEDLTKTILTYTLIDKYRADKRAEWDGTWKIALAGLDPAFTSAGDECILQFAEMGPMANGLIGLDYGGEENTLSLQLDTTLKEPINYQIVRQAKKECIKRGVKPEHFGADTWGIGIGAGDIFEVEWSPDIHKIIGIGKASEQFVDSEVGETAYEVYADITTELWFAMRTFTQSGQIRGLNQIAIDEFCSREYSWKGRRLAIEAKEEYKRRMGREDSPTGSPDRADACAVVLEVARRAGFKPDARRQDLAEQYDFEKRWEEMQGHTQHDSNETPAWGDDAILNSTSFTESDF